MGTSAEIKQKAIALAEKTDVNSITPKEVGGIMYDLASHSENVLRNGGTLGVRKVYESVAAMEADSTNPKDFWGDPIKKGNLVVIYDGTTTGVDNNKIYAFMKPGWELATKLDAGYATRSELSELASNVIDFELLGAGQNPVYKYVHLVSGRRYKIEIINNDYLYNEINTGSRVFSIFHKIANSNVYDVQVLAGSNVEKCYELIAEDSDEANKYRITVRANVGEKVYVRLTDVTDVRYNLPRIAFSNALQLIDYNSISFNTVSIMDIDGNMRTVGKGEQIYTFEETTGNILVVDRKDNIVFRGNSSELEATDLILLVYQPFQKKFVDGVLLNQIIDLSDKELNISFKGKGDKADKKYIHLVNGHLYRITIVNTEWEVDGESPKLGVTYRDLNDALKQAIYVQYNEEVSGTYYVMAKEALNDNKYTIFVRAAVGETVFMNIEDVSSEELKKKDFNIELSAGCFGDTSGYPKAALHKVEDAIMFFSSYYDIRFYKVKEKLRIEKIDGLDSDQSLRIYTYDEDFNFIRNISVSKFPFTVSAKYVRFEVRSTDTKGYKNKILKLSLIGCKNTPILEGYRVEQVYGEHIKYLPFEIESHIQDNEESIEIVDTERNFSNGYISLPVNYDRFGKPCKLAILCHGTSTYPFETNDIDDVRIKWLNKCGYAVIDCSGYGWNNYKNNQNNVDGNMPTPLAINSYISFYRYIIKNFNVEKEVCVYGKSSGSMLALAFGNLNVIPVKCVAVLAGTNSAVLNMMGVANTRSNYYLKELGCENPNVDTYLGSAVKGLPCSTKDVSYIVSNYEKIKDYDPLMYGVVNLDSKAFSKKAMEVGFNGFEKDAELNEMINSAYKNVHCPVKLFHAKDDERCPLQIPIWTQKIIKNAGGICFLRLYPEGSGGHYFDSPGHEEGGGTAPTIANYTTKFGETIENMGLAYAELIEWFDRW